MCCILVCPYNGVQLLVCTPKAEDNGDDVELHVLGCRLTY